MTKSELKTGMLVEMRNGDLCMVFKDVATEWAEGDVVVQVDGNEWDTLDNFDDQFRHNDEYCNDWDFMKIYKQRHALTLRGKPEYNRNIPPIWERPKSYTYEELKAIIGHDFEIFG